jgi:hypothetical protein
VIRITKAEQLPYQIVNRTQIDIKFYEQNENEEKRVVI